MNILQQANTILNAKIIRLILISIVLTFTTNNLIASSFYTSLYNTDKGIQSTENYILQDSIHQDIDKPAQYPGGNDAIYKFLAENIKYPTDAKDANIEGTVYIQCVIDVTGKIDKIDILRSPNESLSQAAIEVIQQLNTWTPAEKDGQKVASYLTIPVKFAIPKKKEK